MKKNVENCNLNEFNKEFQNRHVNSGYNNDYLYKIEYFMFNLENWIIRLKNSIIKSSRI
jgi:hypothetical protein